MNNVEKNPSYTELAPEIAPFYDKDTNTFSYVVRDPSSPACAVIDSVLDFDYPSGAIHYYGADAIINYIKEHQLTLEWLIETHVHADHLSAAPYIQEQLGGKLAIGEHVITVQNTFGKIFNEGTEFERNGSQFDHLFTDGEEYSIGNLKAKTIHTPGHTPACMVHIIGDAAFVGDTIFMPDGGTARADFPGGSAEVLFDSIQKVLSLPAQTRLFMCHDYCPEGRELEYQTSISEELEKNIHVNKKISKKEFVAMREKRDKTLDMPRLILPSLQVNMRAGHFPEPENNDLVYLKIPVNAFS
ncbi:MAG: MBL fold metallo-hydrolase [Cellvibrionaceae bacterium]